MERIKTALCMSGHMRTYLDNYDNLKKYLLDNESLDIDIFIYTWNILDNVLDIDIRSNYNDIKELYKPKFFIMNDTINFNYDKIFKSKNTDCRNVNGLISMFYAINQCNHLKSQYENENNFIYDCVIRFRPDILLEENIKINKDDLSKLNIPLHGDFDGINDQFAFSNSKNMNLYSQINNRMNKYVKVIGSLCPEKFVKMRVKECGFEINRPEIKYKLVRNDTNVFDNKYFEEKWGFKKEIKLP